MYTLKILGLFLRNKVIEIIKFSFFVAVIVLWAALAIWSVGFIIYHVWLQWVLGILASILILFILYQWIKSNWRMAVRGDRVRLFNR